MEKNRRLFAALNRWPNSSFADTTSTSYKGGKLAASEPTCRLPESRNNIQDAMHNVFKNPEVGAMLKQFPE